MPEPKEFIVDPNSLYGRALAARAIYNNAAKDLQDADRAAFKTHVHVTSGNGNLVIRGIDTIPSAARQLAYDILEILGED